MEALLEQERVLRAQKDDESMLSIMQQIISLCKTDLEVICYLKILTRRKGQLKEPLRRIVHQCFEVKYSQIQSVLPDFSFPYVCPETAEYCKYVLFCDMLPQDTLLSEEVTEKIADFVSFSAALLKEVIEGRFVLEQERVLVTRTLKGVFERICKFREAMEVVYGVPVETFSSVPDVEKIQFQLEVLRLCLVNQEWSRCEIMAKRIRKSYFRSLSAKKDEINFVVLRTGVALGQGRFLEVAQLLRTLVGLDDDSKSFRVSLCSFFSIIADRSIERDHLMDYCEKSLYNNHKVRERIRQFLGTEILTRAFTNDFGEQAFITKHAYDYLRAIDHHNLNIVSKFFSSIKIEDLVGLLQCPLSDCVDLLTTAVNSRTLDCKIDQLLNIVEFSEETGLEDENIQIEKVLKQISKINCMIDKENMHM